MFPETSRKSSPFLEKIAVGIGSKVDPAHCQTPFELAGVTPRDFATRKSTITFCRRAIYFSTYSVATITLIDLLQIKGQQQHPVDLMGSVLHSYARFYVEDFASLAAGTPIRSPPCTPVEQIYARAFSPTANCDSPYEYVKPSAADVERYLWPIFRANADKLGFDIPEGSPASNLWIIERWFMTATAQGIFDLVAAHELAHIMAGDPWAKRIDALAEQKADAAAVDVLSEGSPILGAAISALNTSLMLHTGITFETWQAKYPISSLADRLSRSLMHSACMILSKGSLNEATSADERKLIQSFQARVSTSSVNCP